MSAAAWRTCDLSDAHGDALRIPLLPWRDYGGRVAFHGTLSTVRAFEDNSRVREAVHEPGAGRVLVVDAGGSLRRSMLGDLLAAKAVENGWAGLVIAGAIRDAAVIATLDLGVKALGTVPRKTERRDQGLRDVPVQIGGATLRPGDWLAADADGIVVADHPLA
ncbi:RraA family protein [Lysobacter pythonis]|uniref:4-hydroxy-4-methyl-2-oxoglutarate aldolase n=1 Tax=Solilutibacter pythonis TaxID=2483112 RepID=A0A3M2I526_9GAMM|nr:ribonuclease E activity regulator RraA [Lysobacter pythonis]RMH93364.1 RraA family protein [Lysobacter pythonis]